MRNLLIAVLGFLMLPHALLRAQEAEPAKGEPEWLTQYYDFFTLGTGCWVTSNADYITEKEPSDAYYVVWTSAIGGNGKNGRLYGTEKGVKTPDFWDFRIYWDGASQQLKTQQFGQVGVVGLGTLIQESATHYIQIQDYSLPDGRVWKDKHLIELVDEAHVTTSYDWDGKHWQKNRSYTWERCK